MFQMECLLGDWEETQRFPFVVFMRHSFAMAHVSASLGRDRLGQDAVLVSFGVVFLPVVMTPVAFFADDAGLALVLADKHAPADNAVAVLSLAAK